jgi:hypothetical protein
VPDVRLNQHANRLQLSGTDERCGGAEARAMTYLGEKCYGTIAGMIEQGYTLTALLPRDELPSSPAAPSRKAAGTARIRTFYHA